MYTFKKIPNTYIQEILFIDNESNIHNWNKLSLMETFYKIDKFGIFLQDKLIAYILYQVVLDEIDIVHLVCDKNHQNKGISTKLLIKFTDIAGKNGMKNIFLEMRTDNLNAQKLYESCGFKDVGLRKSYYKDGCDALIKKLVIN